MMQIFNLPNSALVDDKKMITTEWQKTFSDLYQQAQRELGNAGFLIPPQPSANVDQLVGNKLSGNLVLDTGRSALIININGALYSINVTAI
jgi:hypothetical protein